VCCLVYTSGTTAEPKGVQHTHRTLLAELATLPLLLAAGPGGGFLQAFPAGHIAGLLGLFNPVLHGVPTVLLDAWDPHLAARLVAGHRLTSTSGSPYFLSSLLDAAEAAGLDLSSMGAFMTGAAPVPPALVERAERAGVATYRAYGSSEHPTVTSGLPSDSLDRRATTDGRCAPGNEVRIEDDGEVLVRGPELFVGYRDTALDAAAFTPDGWFRTGDIGVVDGEGFLTITDRKKDIIIRGGENIASKEVEDVLARHPAVAEAAVVAAPDQRMGERVCAFVRLAPGATFGLEEARAHVAAAGLARHKAPERLEVVGDFPRTPSGKIRKVELRDALRDEAPPSS
jgi:acyl-CoA synthetase (AMP-forming)/AMP-acid ligase II